MTSALLAWILALEATATAPPGHAPGGAADFRSQAEAADRAGDWREADRTAALYLDAAGTAALSAAWLLPARTGEERPAAAADAALDQAAAFVVPLAIRHESWWLLARAFAWSPRAVEAHRDPLRRALAAAPYAARLLPDDVVRAAAAADPSLAVRLAIDGPDRSGPVTVAQAQAAGVAGIRWLDAELDRGLEAADREAVRRAAEALAASDPAHVEALLALELLQEDPQRLRRANLDLNPLVRPWHRDAAQTLIRLHRALARDPGDVRLRLALAWRQQRAGVSADARHEAQAIAADAAAPARVREAAEAIAALASLDLGDGAAFTGWLSRRVQRPSRFVAEQTINVVLPKQAPPAVLDARRTVLNRTLAAKPSIIEPGVSDHWRWLAIKDDKLDEAARRRALEAALADDAELMRVGRSCASEKLAFDACVARVEAVNELRSFDESEDDDDDRRSITIDPAGLPKRLGPQLEIAPGWLAGLRTLPPEKLALLAPWLDGLRGRPIARSRQFALLDILVRWARKDAAGARRAIDEALPRLSLPERTALRLLAEDLERKLVTVDRAADLFEVPADVALAAVGEPAKGPVPAWMAEVAPGSDRLSALRRGLSLLGEGHAQRALDTLRPLLGALSGPERGEIAGYVFLAAVAAGDEKVRAQAAAQAAADAPGSAAALRIGAVQAGAPADGAGSDAPVARWLQAAPDSNAAARAWLAAVVARGAPPAADAHAQDLMARAARILSGPFVRLGPLIAAGQRLDAACWKAVVAENADRLSACPAPALAVIGKKDFAITFTATGRIGEARDAAGIVRAARIAAQLLGDRPHQKDDQLAWLWYVAGDFAKSRSARGKPDGDAEDQPLSMLLAGRPSGDARRRRDLYRQLAFQPLGHDARAEDDDARPALDWSAAARDAGTSRQRAEMWHLACLAAARQHAGRAGNVLTACGAAWRQGRQTPAVASGLANALFGDIEAARKEGFEAKAFLAQARQVLGDRLPGAVSAHEARWLISLGRVEEAARAYEAAWAAGAGEVGEGVSSHELVTAPFNPLLARYRAAVSGTPTRKAFALALLSISAGDTDVFAAYTGQARAFYDKDADHADEKGLALFEDLLVLISADTQDRTLDRSGIVRVARRLFESGNKEPLPDIERAYPRSTLVTLLVIEEATAPDDAKKLVDRARALIARFPSTGIVAADCAALLARAGFGREGQAVLNAARAVHPGNPFLVGFLRGAEPEAPPIPARTALASPESWSRLLSAPVEVPADAAGLQVIRDEEIGISAVLPAAFKKESMAGPGIGFGDGEVNLLFLKVPRMTYCEGLACLDQVLPALELQGFKKQWRRVLTTPVGPGAEALLTTSDRGLLVTGIPTGGNVYFVMAGGPIDRLPARGNAIRMAYRSVRPLDVVLPQPVARRLLPYGWGDARGLLQARLATAKPTGTGSGCPLRAVIDAASFRSSGKDLLLDAFLTTPWSATRLQLLGCESGAAPSAALTVAGLWDDDRAVRKRAAERAGVDPAGVLAEARRLMSGDTPIEPGAGSTGPAHDHRWLQLLLALPEKERGDLVRALLHRDEPHLRAVGLLAPRFCDVDSGRELYRIVRDGATADVRIAMRAFPDPISQPLRDAIWGRFDHAKAPLPAPEKSLLFELAAELAQAPAAGDRARLERLQRLVSTGPAGRRPEAAVDRFRVEALLRPPPRAHTPLPGGGPIPLADRPLSEMLPGNRWSYVRVPRPEQLLSRLGRLGRRLKASSSERQRLAQAFVSRVVGEATSVRAWAGGIDLTQPIECASPDGRFGDLICAAAREPEVPLGGDDTLRALHVIQMVTGGAVLLPVVLPGLPFILHQTIYERAESTGAGQRPTLVHEAAEISRETPAGPLTWNIDVDINTDGAGELEDKITLRSKRRLLFSNSPALARRFLMPAGASEPAVAAAAGPVLADDPDFRKAAGRFAPGADVTAVVVDSDGEAGLQQAVTLEMSITARGVAARVRLPLREGGANHRAGGLARALPKGSALLFGAGDIGWGNEAGGQRGVWPDSAPLPPAEDAGVEPPTWLGGVTTALAFGWYPRAGGRFWDSWLGVVTWDDKVAAAWRRRGMPDPSRNDKAAAAFGGYRFKLAGQTLLVANDQGLLDEAVRKQATDPASTAEEPVTALFDGGRVATSLEEIAERAPGKDAGTTLRSWAALASIVKTASLSSSVDRQRGEVVIESLLAPEVEGATPAALVDEWVAESRIRNTLMLPRALPLADSGKPIRFVLDVEHDRQFTRAFPTTSRQQVERVGQGRWRVSVSPSPGPDQPVRAESMSPGERARWLDAGNISPRIVSAAKEIIPDRTEARQAVQLVLAWMKRNMTYELTPRDVSDVAILERRRGDCSEYSKLAVALLRARGIPARTRSGFLAEASTLVAHAWVEFFDGTGWREIDPVAGTPSVDARHIDASVADVLSLLSLAQIRVVAVE